MIELTASMVKETIDKVDYIIDLYKKHQGLKRKPEISWPERWNEEYKYDIRVMFVGCSNHTGPYTYDHFFISPKMLANPEKELAVLFKKRKKDNKAREKEDG